VGKWLLVVDYNDYVSTSGGTGAEVKPAGEAVRVHEISIATPSSDSGGKLTLEMSRGSDPPQNQATETWELTIFGQALQNVSTVNTIPTEPTAASGGLQASARTLDTTDGYRVNLPSKAGGTGILLVPTLRIITNPSTGGVKRWNAKENTSIDVVVGDTAFFHNVPGSQGVLIKGEFTPSQPPPVPTPTVSPENRFFDADNNNINDNLEALMASVSAGTPLDVVVFFNLPLVNADLIGMAVLVFGESTPQPTLPIRNIFVSGIATTLDAAQIELLATHSEVLQIENDDPVQAP